MERAKGVYSGDWIATFWAIRIAISLLNEASALLASNCRFRLRQHAFSLLDCAELELALPSDNDMEVLFVTLVVEQEAEDATDI